MTPSTIKMPENLEPQEAEEMETLDARDTAEMLVGDNGVAYTPHPGDPRADQAGMYCQGVEWVRVPIRPACKVKASIYLIECDGGWMSGRDYHGKGFGACLVPRVNDMPLPTRKDAALYEIDLIEEGCSGRDNRVMDDLAAFRAKVEAWPDEDEPTAEVANADAEETQPAATSPEPGVIEPTAHFAQRLREATERVAQAVLVRLSTEAEAKRAKAEEKAAGEALQKIIDRGPEDYPLFDGAVETAAVVGQAEPESGQAEQAAVAEAAPAWWLYDTDLLFADEPLPGFGPKLIAAICEAAPTMADLEELRGGAGLDSIKGVSKAKADALTNRILERCGEWERDAVPVAHFDDQPSDDEDAVDGDADAGGEE